MPHNDSADGATVAAFLRALAERAERDPAFGRQVAETLRACGLMPSLAPATTPTVRRGNRAPSPQPRPTRQRTEAAPGATPLPDPFLTLRAEGEDGLRRQLAPLDAPALRQIVRAHRLDPARLSARWTNRERLVDLIVTQTRARADHGKAFARL
jgi:hypothetical protein